MIGRKKTANNYLMIFEEVSVGFRWMFLVLVAASGRDTPLAPLERGVLDADFFLVISGLLCLFPLLRGD